MAKIHELEYNSFEIKYLIYQYCFNNYYFLLIKEFFLIIVFDTFRDFLTTKFTVLYNHQHHEHQEPIIDPDEFVKFRGVNM